MGWTDTATDVLFVAALLNVSCSQTSMSMDVGAPYVNSDAGVCYFSSPGQSTCDATPDRAHFCCCAPDPSMCETAPAPAGWNLAAPGESCGSHCGNTGCSQVGRNKANSLITITVAADEVGEDCSMMEATLSTAPFAPYIDNSSGRCFFSSTASTATCTATNNDVSQLCCCGGPGDCPVE